MSLFHLIIIIIHRISPYRLVSDLFIVEGLVIYTIKGGKSVDPLPFSAFFGLANGKIHKYRVYVDNAPLYASIAALAEANK